MTREFDEVRAMKALDRLFKENEELKARLAILERLVNNLVVMKEIRDEQCNKQVLQSGESTGGELYEGDKCLR
jgi:hypothetical protein